MAQEVELQVQDGPVSVECMWRLQDQSVSRVCIGLPNVCIGIDEEVGESIYQKIKAVNQAILVLNEKVHTQNWYLTLEKIMSMTINGKLVGLSTRILFDKEIIDTEITSTYMHLSLSRGNTTLFSAQWIEGFLNGSQTKGNFVPEQHSDYIFESFNNLPIKQ